MAQDQDTLDNHHGGNMNMVGPIINTDNDQRTTRAATFLIACLHLAHLPTLLLFFLVAFLRLQVYVGSSGLEVS